MKALIVTCAFAISAACAHSVFLGSDIRSFDVQNLALLAEGFGTNDLIETLRTSFAHELDTSGTTLTRGMVHTRVVDLNDDGYHDLIALIDSPGTCDSGGCAVGLIMRSQGGERSVIRFPYVAKRMEAIEVLDTKSNGMHEIRLNGDTSSRLVWNGMNYSVEEI